MAYGSVNVPGGALAGKQDKLTGAAGQIVGFDKNGNAVPQEAPATGVTSFNGRGGDVAPQEGDYTASMVGALAADGTAKAATKLETARTIRTNLSSTTAASFDGTASITPGVTGTLPVAYGGTGVSTLTGTDYTTSRVRGIALTSSVPSSLSNGCVSLVYV